MKLKIERPIYKILKTLWFIFGGLISLWTFFWYIKILTIGELGGVMASTILLASGIYALSIYIMATLLFLLIRFIIKKLK